MNVPGSRYRPSVIDGLPARISGQWAREKLKYLDKYIHLFNVGMKNRWRNRLFLDLLAGGGKCVDEDTGEEFDGSPRSVIRRSDRQTSGGITRGHHDRDSGAVLAPSRPRRFAPPPRSAALRALTAPARRALDQQLSMAASSAYGRAHLYASRFAFAAGAASVDYRRKSVPSL